MFSLDQLIFAMAADQRCNMETLAQVEPMIRAVLEKEQTLRNSIKVSARKIFTAICFFVIQKVA